MKRNGGGRGGRTQIAFLLSRRVGTISILQGEYWLGQAQGAKHWTRPCSIDTATNSIFSLERRAGPGQTEL